MTAFLCRSIFCRFVGQYKRNTTGRIFDRAWRKTILRFSDRILPKRRVVCGLSTRVMKGKKKQAILQICGRFAAWNKLFSGICSMISMIQIQMSKKSKKCPPTRNFFLGFLLTLQKAIIYNGCKVQKFIVAFSPKLTETCGI